MTARSLTVPADIQRCDVVSDNRPSELLSTPGRTPGVTLIASSSMAANCSLQDGGPGRVRRSPGVNWEGVSDMARQLAVGSKIKLAHGAESVPELCRAAVIGRLRPSKHQSRPMSLSYFSSLLSDAASPARLALRRDANPRTEIRSPTSKPGMQESWARPAEIVDCPETPVSPAHRPSLNGTVG